MKRGYSLMLIIFLVLTPTLVMVAVPGTDSAITVVEDETVLQDIPEEDVELTSMFFTETASSDGGLYYVCRRGIDAVAYFGASMVKYLSGGSVFTLEFPESNLVLPAGETPTGSKTNYLFGNEPAEWKTGITDYSLLRYDEIYPGIDLVYKIQDGSLKYEFVVDPFAKPNQIQLKYVDADSVEVDEKDLIITRGKSRVVDAGLKVFQSTNGLSDIVCKYTMTDNGNLGFDLRDYDSSRELVIDPVILLYSTFLGGSNDEIGKDIALEDGYTYVTGYVYSSDFPVFNANDSTFNGGTFDCFLTKFSIDGQSLIYSTYLGGSGNDYGASIAVEDGCVYISGETKSADFPLVNAIDSIYAGTSECFVAKFTADGQSLIYSTFLGGTYGGEIGYGIAVENGYAYVVGRTPSSDFPIFNAFNSTHGGSYDCFVTKFDVDGQSLVYSTYLGGSNEDDGYDIVVEDGYVYITGETQSSNFPTVNAYDSLFDGFYDGFVTKLAIDGQSLVYSTFLGGSSTERSYSIDVEDGYVCVTGETDSTDFPTVNSYDSIHGGFGDCFVTKFAVDGQSLIYSTYLGGSNYDTGRGLVIEDGYVYLVGYTMSSNFPTIDALDTSLSGTTDCFVVNIATDGTSPLYSTYLGGSLNEEGHGIAVDDGYVYVTGTTSSSNFPTIKAYNSSRHGTSDCFVSILLQDTDGDTLSDSQEIFLGTSIYFVDSDNDNFLDAYEIQYGSDPTDPDDYPAIPQYWYDEIYEDLDGNATLIQQIKNWLDGNYTAIQALFTYVEGNATLLLDTVSLVGDNTDDILVVAALATANYDWLEDLNVTAIEDIALIQEVIDLLGVSVGDGDYDGLDDLTELSLGTDILCIDTDCDNLNDAFEVKLGTDPLDDDSDGDSYLDGLEYIAGTNPLDALDYPTSPVGPDNTMLYVVIGGAGVVVVVILGVFFKKRRTS